MNTHKVEAVLAEDETLLPFHAGDAMEVIILKGKVTQQTVALLNQPETNLYLYPLRGKVVRYEHPS